MPTTSDLASLIQVTSEGFPEARSVGGPMCPSGCNNYTKWLTDNGQMGAIRTTEEQVHGQELAMATSNLRMTLVLA